MKLGRVVDHGPRINFRIGANRKRRYINLGGHFNNGASQISVTEDTVHSLKIKISFVCHFYRISLTKDIFGA